MSDKQTLQTLIRNFISGFYLPIACTFFFFFSKNKMVSKHCFFICICIILESCIECDSRRDVKCAIGPVTIEPTVCPVGPTQCYTRLVG